MAEPSAPESGGVEVPDAVLCGFGKSLWVVVFFLIYVHS